jgi:hypothetical protein
MQMGEGGDSTEKCSPSGEILKPPLLIAECKTSETWKFPVDHIASTIVWDIHAPIFTPYSDVIEICEALERGRNSVHDAK